MDYITVREAAEKWHLAERTVQQLGRDGRIEGGRKFGGTWAIPAQAARPTDSRRDGGRGPSKRPAPIALRRGGIRIAVPRLLWYSLLILSG